MLIVELLSHGSGSHFNLVGKLGNAYDTALVLGGIRRRPQNSIAARISNTQGLGMVSDNFAPESGSTMFRAQCNHCAHALVNKLIQTNCSIIVSATVIL